MVSDLATGKTKNLVRAAIQLALPSLPGEHAAAPLYYALLAGLQAIRENNEVHDAVLGGLKGRDLPALGLGEEVWKQARRLAGISSNTEAGRIAEIALKRTFTSLLNRYSAEVADRTLPILLAVISRKVTDEKFVEELLTNYLFELALRQMRTTNARREYDGARAYHFVRGELISSEEESALRQDLRNQCGVLAKRAKKNISEAGVITALKENRQLSDELLKSIKEALALVLGQPVE